ncbi:MAG: RodZ domain-containing protein [Pseudomonadota bacterium]
MTSLLRAEAAPDNSQGSHSAAKTSRPDVFGQQLRRARQKLNLSVEEIAQRIKLDPKQVSALEEERFDDLPGAAFVRGFARQYARIVNVDETALLNLLPASSAQLHSTAAHLGVVPRTKDFESRRRNRTLKILAGLLIGAGAIGSGVYFAYQHLPASFRNASTNTTGASLSPINSTTPVIADTPVVATPIQAPASAGEATAIGTPLSLAPQLSTAKSTPLEPSDGHAAQTGSTHITLPGSANAAPPRIELNFEDRAWVEIKDAQGRVLLSQSQMNLPGSHQSVNGTPPYEVTISNPRAVTLQYKGSALDITKTYTNNNIARFTLD